MTTVKHCNVVMDQVWFHHIGEWRVRCLWCRVCNRVEDFYPNEGSDSDKAGTDIDDSED